MNKRLLWQMCGMAACMFFCAACGTASMPAKAGNVKLDPHAEPQWIRDGEPVTFEGEQWYPQDEVENLLDNETLEVGTFRNIPVFVEKIDVRPYNRLYTRFAPHKFRYFEKRAAR